MDAERGPFRTAEPTVEVKRAREHEASFERVREGTEAAIAAQRVRDRALDRWAWAFFGASILAAVGVGLSMAFMQGVGGPLSCPAVALVLVAVLTLVYRRRVGSR